MGRKSRQKKAKREAAAQPPSPQLQENDPQPTEFVRQLERKGYSLSQIQRSPELPNDKVDPQV